ncbi:MAG: hypothetical protein ACP5K9_01410 [Candidatus Micrarchaeia archaeon]
MLETLLMQTLPGCTYGGINQNNWININIIVIIASLSIAAFFYALSNLFPTRTREKARGVVRFEFFQGMISTFIIVILVGSAQLSCSLSQSIAGPISTSEFGQTYNGQIFQYDQFYVGNLLFNKGVGLMTNIYSAAIGFFIAAEVIHTLGLVGSILPYPVVGDPNAADGIFTPIFESENIEVSLGPSPDLGSIYDSYSLMLTDVLSALVVVTFGLLFFIYLMLPFISAIALTVVLPVALIMRSLSFAGPKLREAANSFLALSVGFYFVFPIMLMFNSYAMGWTFCTFGVSPCNPYSQYISYNIAKLPLSSIFTSRSTNIDAGPLDFTLPVSFFSSAFSEYINPFNAPGAMVTIASQVGEYMFEGIFLVAIAVAITVAFSIGLAKALNSGMNFVAGGSFWG